MEPSKRAWISRAVVALALALAVGIPLYHGLGRFYLANSDQDVDLTYQALVVNSGRPLPFHPHTGYGYTLLLAPWLRAAEGLGLIETARIDPLIGAPQERFEALYTQVMAAGRAFSVLLAALATLLFRQVLVLACRDGRVAAMGTLLFGASIGLGNHSSVLRTELLSMMAILGGLAALLAALRRGGVGALGWLGLCAFLATFAGLVKVQAVLVAAFLPVVPFVFPAPAMPKPPRGTRLAALVALPLAMGAHGLGRLAEALAMAPGWGYQGLALALGTGLVTLYARRQLGRAAWALPALAALAGGVGAAASLAAIHEHWWTLYGIASPLDFLAINRRNEVTDTGVVELAAAAIRYGAGELGELLLVWHAGPRDYPLQVVFWFAIAAPAYLAVKRRWQPALAAGLFGAAGFGLIALFTLRGYFYYYQIYTEPLLILAAAVALTALAAASRRETLVLAVTLAFVLYAGASTTRFRLLAPSVATTRGPEHACCSADYATLIAPGFAKECARATTACPLNWNELRAVQGAILRRPR